MKQKTNIGTWIGFVAILVWCLLPVVWIISLSFKSEGETAAGSAQFLPKEPTIANYKAIIDNPDFTRALINSFGIALIATLLSVIFATLAAYAIARLEFKGKRLVLSLALAMEALTAAAPGARRRPTAAADVVEAVVDYYGVTLRELRGRARTKEIVLPRQVAMYLAKQLTSRSLPEIGRRFGNRDHTSVLHAVNKITELMAEDTSFAEDVMLLRKMLEV